MPSCASATPTAARPGPAAMPRAASRDLLARRPAARTQVIATVAGNLPLRGAGRRTLCSVDMGPARLDWREIPLARPMDTLHLDLARGPAGRSGGRQHGQPARDVLRRRRRARCRWRRSAPVLEHDPLFPERANIGFAQILAPDRIRLRVWERGAGMTLACGSGACAALVNAASARAGGPARAQSSCRRRRAGDRSGGEDGHVLMTGPVATAFTGEHRLSDGRIRHERVEIVTFGCRLNAYESEVMRGRTRAALSDTVIVNTCAVTAEAERQARQAIRRAARERPGARIVVTGCAAQIDPAALGGAARRGPGAGQRREAAARRAGRLAPRRRGRRDIMAARETAAHLVTEFAGRARAFVQVQQGCDHRCTFCIIPFGRGPSRSVPVGAVVAQVRALVEAGLPEVVLTGVDIASYGPDLPGAPTPRPAGAAAAGAGAGAAAAPALLARSGGDRRRRCGG